MAGEVQDNIWPLPKFHFKLEVDELEANFQEISGMDAEVDIIEYRHGDSPEFSTIKMPCLRKSSDISLKKGTPTCIFKEHTSIFPLSEKQGCH